jgi:hypothetical protein
MGIFRTKSDAQRQVEENSSAIANAVWKVANGYVGADFIDFVVEGHGAALRDAVAALALEQGEEKARKIALKSAKLVADVDPNKTRGLHSQIESVMLQVLDQR